MLLHQSLRRLTSDGAATVLPRRDDARLRFEEAGRRISGIIFDVPGVLYDGTLWTRWLFQLLSRMGMYSHFTAFARLWEEEYLPRVNLNGDDYWETLRTYLSSLGFTRGQIDEVQAAGQVRRRAFDENARPLPHVRPTLEQLSRAGMPLGVCCIGPWNGRQVSEQLERLHLADLFQAVAAVPRSAGQASVDRTLAEVASRLALATNRTAIVSCRVDCLQAALRIRAIPVAFNLLEPVAGSLALEHFDALSGLACRPAAACPLAG